MNWPYFHMIINHFPIILGVMGAAAAVLGLVVPRRGVWLYALASLTLAALSAYPAVFTGERAEHVLEEAWYVQAGALEEHEESGKLALWVKLATGIVSAWAWRRTVKGAALRTARVAVRHRRGRRPRLGARGRVLGARGLADHPLCTRTPPARAAAGVHAASDSTGAVTGRSSRAPRFRPAHTTDATNPITVDMATTALIRRALLLAILLPTGDALAQSLSRQDPSGQEVAKNTPAALYLAACAACHGADGRGAPEALVGFDVPLPDFTDCRFATREPDVDWLAVVHEGGPVRGFSRLMPAFGDALTDEEIQLVLDYVRTLCDDDDWPRGELNLPRPLVTEKAYPEDEAVFETAVGLEGPGSVVSTLVFERRFRARNQFEVSLPFGIVEREPGGWTGGIGDLALGVKRVFFHSLERGTIVSGTAELILPTGDEDDGLGSGTTVFEPFVSIGQILPADAFLHLQAGVEVPLDRDVGEDEAFWRAALGRSFTEGRWGRTWSPMIELLGERTLASGESTLWDLVPQFQVALNTRQHVMAAIGVRVPINETGSRQTRLLAYLLWDWFDGGFFEGW